MITRRQIVIAMCAGALAAPLPLYAQRERVRRIGYLANDPDTSSPTYQAFVARLRELGWVSGKNIEILYLTSKGKDKLFPMLAKAAVDEKVDVIVTTGSPSTRAAQQATDTIPIVFGSAGNPVEQKFVKSLARPGGNITGLALVVQDLGPKRLEYMREMLPNATRSARFYDPNSLKAVQSAIMRSEDEAAQKLRLSHVHIAVPRVEELESAFENAARSAIEIAHVTAASLFVVHRRRVAELALKHRLPLLGPDRRFTAAGALLSYGENFEERYARAASLVDRILRGAKPADLPVDESMKFELVVNRTTAKTLGIAIPPSFWRHKPTAFD